MILVEVPGRLYGDRCLRIAALAFFGVFIGCALLAMARPESAAAFLGQNAVDDLREMYASAPRDRSADTAGQMYGFYINNNIGNALSCFASGIFAGIGSLLWLAANGVMIGLSFGYMTTVGDPTRAHFFEFVTAHGPFELTGITLAGAAGLRLGWGLVDTRGLPRLQSLLTAARESVPILAMAAILVAMAAPIEAFVSPSSLPLVIKRDRRVLRRADHRVSGRSWPLGTARGTMNIDHTDIVVRERRLPELYDLALLVAQRHAGALALLWIIGCTPWMVLNWWLLSAGDSAQWGHWYSCLLLMAVESPFASAPLNVYLGTAMFDGNAR